MMRMTRIKSSLGCCVLLAAVCLAGLSAPAQNVLGHFPEAASMALYLPSVDVLDQEISPLLEAVGAKNLKETVLGGMPSRLGLDENATISETLKAAGIDTSKPAAFFVKGGFTGAQDFGLLLPVANGGALAEKMPAVFEGDAPEYSANEAAGRFSDTQKLGYLVAADQFFMGTSKDMITAMMDRAKKPYESPYASQAGSEVAVVTSIAKLQAAGVLPEGTSAGVAYSTIYDYFKEFIGEIVLAAGESDGASYIRLAMANPSGSVTAPASAIKMHNLFPDGAPVMLNLRNDAKLMQTIRPLLTSIPGLGQGAMYISLISSMLGDEMGIALTGVSNGIPDGLIAAKVSNPASVKGLMGMAGAKDGPKEQVNGADIYALENIRDGLSVYIASLDTNLLVSTNLDTVKKALEKVSPEGVKEGGSPVNAAVLAKGNNGFLVLDGSKLDASKLGGIPLPAGLDVSSINLLATLGSAGNWNELRISTPGSVKDLGGLVGGLTR